MLRPAALPHLACATTLPQVPRPGLLGSARPMLELFVRDSQRRQTHVAQLAGGRASWGSRFEFPVSLPGGRGCGMGAWVR